MNGFVIFRGFEDMANNLSDLEALIDLAKEPSSEKRRQLLRDITDVFLLIHQNIQSIRKIILVI